MDTLPPHAVKGKVYSIYALVDPRDFSVHYVGQTTDVYRRFEQHLACHDGNAAKDAWIRELESEQIIPVMKTLEQVSDLKTAKQREAHWIHQYRHIRMPLANQVKTGRRFTDEQVDKILDTYLLTGKFPPYISKRQCRDYRNHKRLEVRKMLLRRKK